jgi:hypothetical protein
MLECKFKRVEVCKKQKYKLVFVHRIQAALAESASDIFQIYEILDYLEQVYTLY